MINIDWLRMLLFYLPLLSNKHLIDGSSIFFFFLLKKKWNKRNQQWVHHLLLNSTAYLHTVFSSSHTLLGEIQYQNITVKTTATFPADTKARMPSGRVWQGLRPPGGC